MDDGDGYEKQFEQVLASLTDRQRSAFSAGMAERFLPVYEAFAGQEDWGTPKEFRQILDSVWAHLGGKAMEGAYLREAAKTVEAGTPHMDDFEDAEAALAAAVMVLEALESCNKGSNLPDAVQAAMSGFEAVAPGWSDDEGEPLNKGLKKKIQEEAIQQQWLVERVRSIGRFDEATIQELKAELRMKEHAGKVPGRKKPQEPKGVNNQVLYEQYRRMVEADIRSSGSRMKAFESMPGMRPMMLISQWAGRYRRRQQTIDGSYGKPADIIGLQALVELNRARDARARGELAWDRDTRQMLERVLGNPLGGLDARKIEEPHGYGPSVRRLWLEGKQSGLSEEAAWDRLLEWANHRPAAWDEKKKRSTALEKRLEMPVTWERTGEKDLPWAAQVDGEAWKIGLGDFPDELLYRLEVNGEAAGRFNDWPISWKRE